MANSIQKIHKTLTQMQKNLECSICLELLQDPVLTKCEHHFCNFCILALLESKRRSSAPCPLCKEPVTKRSLTAHSTLKSIVTSYRNVVAAIEDDTGQKCTPPRGPLPLSQPEPPSQRPKRQERKDQKKSNIRRGKAKNIPVIPIYLDDEEDDETAQSSEQCPPPGLKDNLNVISSFSSPKKTKKMGKKSNSRKGKENTQHSQAEDDQKITGQSEFLEVIANESLGQNGTIERTKVSQTVPDGDEGNVGKDPYEFIASQRTPRKLKKRRVKEKKKKPWEYSFGKISRKKKNGEETDSERWAESQSDDDDDVEGSYVHREDIEDERLEDENQKDVTQTKNGFFRDGRDKNGNLEWLETNGKEIAIVDSSDEEGVKEIGREDGDEEREIITTNSVTEIGDQGAKEHLGKKGCRSAASKAMDAIKGQVILQSSGEGSASGGGGCHGDQDADVVEVTEESYGRSLIDFGSVLRSKGKFSVAGKEECDDPRKTKESKEQPSASPLVNGHISQEFPLSQPPTLNRNHGDKLFAKAYGRGKTKSPGEKVRLQSKNEKNDDDLPDVMNIDVDSDDEGKGSSQDLFVGDVLDPTPPGDAERTVGGERGRDGNVATEGEGEVDGKGMDRQEAGSDGENVAEDVANDMVEEKEEVDDKKMGVAVSDKTMHKGGEKRNGVEETANSTCPQLLKNGASSFVEQTNDLEEMQTLEEDILEFEKENDRLEQQLMQDEEDGDRKEDTVTIDEDETRRSGKKRESVKNKMKNKDGLTPVETATNVSHDPEDHLQSDWELALKLAQEFGSVPPNLEVRTSKRGNGKNDAKTGGSGKKGRPMKQLQIQNVPDTSDTGKHSRRARSRRNLRSKVAEESDDVDINSFQEDSQGDASEKNQRVLQQRRSKGQVKEDDKNASLDGENEISSVQCVPETPHVVAKVTRGSLSSGKMKIESKRKKEAELGVESGDVVEDRDFGKAEEPSGDVESQGKVSVDSKKSQQGKCSSKVDGSGGLSNVPTEDGETVADGSKDGRGRRRSSRLSKSQEEKMKTDECKESRNKRNVDSDTGMQKEAEKELRRKGANGEDGKGRRKSVRLSKSQEGGKVEEGMDERKINSEGDAKRGEEAEGIVIVIDDKSDDDGDDGGHAQVKRASTRLLSKSQEKKMGSNSLGGSSACGGRGRKQGKNGKGEVTSVSDERERQDVRKDSSDENKEDVKGGSHEKRKSLRKQKVDGTPGDRTDRRRSSQSSDKAGKRLDDDDDDVPKESCLSVKDSDAAITQTKGRKGRNSKEETSPMDKTMSVDAESSLQPSIVESKIQGISRNTHDLSGSTTESIALDSTPSFLQPDEDSNSEKSPKLKSVEKEKPQEERKRVSQERDSLRVTRKSKRNSREVKENSCNKQGSFDGSEKRFTESQEQERLVKEKKRADDEEDGKEGGSMLNEENKTDVEADDDEKIVALGKPKLRSRSSGRKRKNIAEKEDMKGGSSGLQDKDEEPVKRSSQRQKDMGVKGQTKTKASISEVENDREKVSESRKIDASKEEREIEMIQREEGERGIETLAVKDVDLGRMGETDEGSVLKRDPTSPDIFTMHLEDTEQDRAGSSGRSNSEKEATKGKEGACGEGDGGETPKTSKRKKKKRKTFAFGNEADLLKGSVIDDGADRNGMKEGQESSKEVQKSGSTTDSGLKDDPQSKHDDSLQSQLAPATEGASESYSNNDQIPVPRCLPRQRNKKSQEFSKSQCDEQMQSIEEEDLFSEEVVSIKRVSSLKSRGKRQVSTRKDDSEMSSKRFCSDSQFLNSVDQESMVPPTPPVTTSLCQIDTAVGSGNASKCKSNKEDVTEQEETSKKDGSLAQAFENIKRNEDKVSGSNPEDKIASSMSSPSISLFQDVEMTGEQEGKKNTVEEVAESFGKSPGAIDQSETDGGIPQKEAQGNKITEKKDSYGSSPEDLPNVLGDGAASHGIQEDAVTEMSKKNVDDLEKQPQEEDEDEDKFAQPYDKPYDEDEPLFDDEYPVSPASSVGRHNLTSASSVLSSQSDLMNSQQQERAKKVLENMEKEIAEMERALAEDEEEVDLVSEKKDEISDKDEEEADGIERGEVTKGKPERRIDFVNASQEAKDIEVEGNGPLEGVESINLSSDEDEKEVPMKKDEKVDGGRRRKTPNRSTSKYGRTSLRKYGKYENLEDIDDDDIAQNVKQNLTEMAEAEKSLDSLLKAHAARRQEEEKEEEGKEESDVEDENVQEDRPSTPPVPSPSSSPPRSPSPAPLLSQKTLARRLSPVERNIQKAEEIVKSYSEERPVASQKRRRVIIEDSDSESEDEVQYRNKRRKSLKLDSLGSCDTDGDKVKGQPDGVKVKPSCKVQSPIQKNGKETPPKTSKSKETKVAPDNPNIVGKDGEIQLDSPSRKIQKVTTPQTSSSVGEGSSSKKKPRKGEMMSLIATGLNKQKLKMVDQLCKKAGCKFSNVFIPSTTHVIVNAGNNLTCERTLKYFQGIAGRRWIISFQWVQDSLSASRLLPLEKYEIRGDSVNGQNHCGPRRARLWKGPPLLGEYNLFCLEPYTGLNKDQLEGLLKACGGTVYQHPSEMPLEGGRENFIIAQHDVQEGETDYQVLYENFCAKVISREWVLDSIAVYTTQPITDYLLCDVTECDDEEDLMSDDDF